MITVVDKPKDTHVEQVRESLRKLGTPGTNEVLSLIIMAAGTLALISCPAARRPSRHIRARAGSTRKLGGLDSPIELENGKVTSGPDLSINVNGMQLPNPFVIGSGPPGKCTRGRIASDSYAEHRMTLIRARDFRNKLSSDEAGFRRGLGCCYLQNNLPRCRKDSQCDTAVWSRQGLRRADYRMGKH